MNKIALNNLLTYLQSLNLTTRNRQWLAEHLMKPQKTTVVEDPTQMTKEEFFANIAEAECQIARGEYYTQREGESLTDMLKRLGAL